jgi:hypothetical protein
MFDKKKFLFSLATAALVAACGGGGGDPPPPTSGSKTPPGGTTGGDTGGNNGGDGGSGSVVEDQVMAGRLEVVGNTVLYPRVNRTIYLPVPIERFEDVHGINDVAPGFTGDESIIGEPYREWDNIDYQPSLTVSPAAPIAAFGIRVRRWVQATDTSGPVGNQTVVGRVAVDLIERADSFYLNGGQPEAISFVIDNVEMSTSATGEYSARMLPNARMHIYGRNLAGQELRTSVAVPEDAVSMIPMYRIPDNYGDDSSVVLMFDFEKAFAQENTPEASRVDLSLLENIMCHCDMRFTMSSVAEIIRPASGTLQEKMLRGEPITVNSQPPVAGAGLVGHAWIRSWDPAPPPDPGYGEDPGSEEPGSGGEPVDEPSGGTNEPDTGTGTESGAV